MLNRKWKEEFLTIPNTLSLLRLCLIPVYMWIYLNASAPHHYYISAAILAASCLTDMVDGIIARKFDMVSNFGKILDPLADKITQFTLILCLAVKYSPLRRLIVLFILKESFQAIAGCIILRKRKILKGALITGKICTTVLFISLISLVMFPSMSHRTVSLITGIDAGFMLLAFGDYFIAYLGKKDFTQDLIPPTDNGS